MAAEADIPISRSDVGLQNYQTTTPTMTKPLSLGENDQSKVGEIAELLPHPARTSSTLVGIRPEGLLMILIASRFERAHIANYVRPSRMFLCACSHIVVSIIIVSAPAIVAQTVQVDSTPSHVLNSFSPPSALGSTVDRVPSNATDVFFRPDQLKEILSAGWGTISYRQNTELFVQAWHWNPKGTWSDPSGRLLRR